MALYRDRYRVESARLKYWDYSKNGYYYITICVQNRKCLFGNVINGKMQLSGIGLIADKYWMEIPNHFSDVRLDSFVIMPNHLHGILIIDKNVGDAVVGGVNGGIVETIHELSLQNHTNKQNHINKQNHTNDRESIRQQRRKMLIPKIIGRFKMQTAKQINEYQNTNGRPFWQKNYYDRILRNRESLERRRRYIMNNPSKWDRDRNNVF